MDKSLIYAGWQILDFDMHGKTGHNCAEKNKRNFLCRFAH
jgi:hypothetical protein